MSSPDFVCVHCKSDVAPATTSLVSGGEDGIPLMIFQGIPCEKCVQCGYEYIQPKTTHKILEQTRDSVGTKRSPYVQEVTVKLVTFRP